MTVLHLFLLKKWLSTQCTFSHTDAAPCEWVCRISDNHGPRMRQCLRNCHRSENARIWHQSHTFTRSKQADFTAAIRSVWRGGDGLDGRSRGVLGIRVINVVGRIRLFSAAVSVACMTLWHATTMCVAFHVCSVLTVSNYKGSPHSQKVPHF